MTPLVLVVTILEIFDSTRPWTTPKMIVDAICTRACIKATLHGLICDGRTADIARVETRLVIAICGAWVVIVVVVAPGHHFVETRGERSVIASGVTGSTTRWQELLLMISLGWVKHGAECCGVMVVKMMVLTSVD